jgi:hypothetical protein
LSAAQLEKEMASGKTQALLLTLPALLPGYRKYCAKYSASAPLSPTL